MFALVDANSFYASCEAVFRPDIKDKPIVVLSNNDGCIVAANAMAKSFGNIMYQPYFKLEKLLHQNGTVVFSSNYELYGDLSHRMHTLLGTYATRQEIYSIDESFLDFSGMRRFDSTAYGHDIKQTVMKHLGLPVAVGIATTKTLAKAANNIAKKNSCLENVMSLSDLSPSDQNYYLSKMDVSDIWGVGRQWSKKLRSIGIDTAFKLKQTSAKKIRSKFNVVLERTVHELNGEPCQDLELIIPDKQEIVSSRAFSKTITDYNDMQQAVARYVSRAAEKLRNQNSQCQRISVGITTNPFQKNIIQYHNLSSTSLIYPSNHTGHLIERSKRCLKKIWRDDCEYKKAFVMLSDISKKGEVQYDLFAQHPRYSNNTTSESLMNVFDKINNRMGKGTCRMGAEGIDKRIDWSMKRLKHSPRYTTNWNELPIARIK